MKKYKYCLSCEADVEFSSQEAVTFPGSEDTVLVSVCAECDGEIENG